MLLVFIFVVHVFNAVDDAVINIVVIAIVVVVVFVVVVVIVPAVYMYTFGVWVSIVDFILNSLLNPTSQIDR